MIFPGWKNFAEENWKNLQIYKICKWFDDHGITHRSDTVIVLHYLHCVQIIAKTHVETACLM